MSKQYILLEDLDVYKLSRKLSNLGWKIYQGLEWQQRKIIGDQFITSIDSVGANIAEGYGRFHYLDKVRFYYNARGSLIESKHWLELLIERKIADSSYKDKYLEMEKGLLLGLNGLIKSVMKAKNNP